MSFCLFTQGDEEKKRGIQPIPMMDRINEKDIPKMQVILML
jgi:hypothetical protein